MDQMSFFDEEKVIFPSSHPEVLNLHSAFIYENEKDEDAFTWNKTQNGYSYSFYGTKVMELTITSAGKAKLSIKQEYINDDVDKKDKGKFVAIPSDADITYYMKKLKKAKQEIFRNLITDTFACCNDFERCSDARKCLKAEDRKYNGCLYRKNLESGRIFYGKNKNI